MWETILEGCARILGLTARPRNDQLAGACFCVAVLGVACQRVWGPAGLLVPAALMMLGVTAALQVVKARDAVWRAARLHLDDPRQPQPPSAITGALVPTAVTLRRLGVALDDARRGRYVSANEALPRIDRALLRPDEVRLLDSVRALISLGLGDTRTAAQQAITTIPTGSEELDTCLGRALIADSWSQPDRLREIEASWSLAGITPDQDNTLARLQRLTQLRIDVRLLDGVSPAEARVLSTEARAVGDEDFAADLEARARERAYR